MIRMEGLLRAYKSIQEVTFIRIRSFIALASVIIEVELFLCPSC